jgi:hypothetical protein
MDTLIFAANRRTVTQFKKWNELDETYKPLGSIQDILGRAKFKVIILPNAYYHPAYNEIMRRIKHGIARKDIEVVPVERTINGIRQ